MSLATFTTWIYLVKLSSFQFTVSFIFTSSPASCFPKICDSSVDILQNVHWQFLLRKISWVLESSVAEQDSRRVDDVFSKYTGQHTSTACAGDRLYFSGFQLGWFGPQETLSNVCRHFWLSQLVRFRECYWHPAGRNVEGMEDATQPSAMDRTGPPSNNNKVWSDLRWS